MSKSMPTTRGLLAGWDLIHHIRALHSKGKFYLSPWIYEPLRLNPPPVPPFRATPPPKIVLPADKLKKTIERYSIHGQSLSIGLAHDYSRRPIDHAAARVKDLMRRDERLTEREAIKIFDREYEHELRMRQRESEMLREDVVKAGEALTPLDAFKILQMTRDLQRESRLTQEKKIEVALKRATARREEVKRTMSERSQHIFDQTQVRFTEDDIKGINIESIEFPERLVPLKKIDSDKWGLHRLISPAQVEKISIAKELKKIVIEVRDMKKKMRIPNATFSSGNEISPFDLIAVYMKAFDINEPDESIKHEEAHKEVRLYGGYIPYGMLMDQVRKFRSLFDQFAEVVVPNIDLNPIMRKIGLETNDEQVDMLKRFGFKKVNLSEIIEQLETYDLSGIETLKRDQRHLEDFFYYLQLESGLRDYYLESREMRVIQEQEDSIDFWTTSLARILKTSIDKDDIEGIDSEEYDHEKEHQRYDDDERMYYEDYDDGNNYNKEDYDEEDYDEEDYDEEDD
jgi:hypothetical protein